MAREIIETEHDIKSGVRALRRRCAVMRAVHEVAGDPPLRRRPAGLPGLARIVIGQQLSIASAGAIWSRFEVAFAPLSAAAILAGSDEAMRSAGLSTGKMRTLRALAAAVADGRLDVDALGQLPEPVAREMLIAVHGIGPWTADLYMMFCLGRRDAFAPGDLALQVAAQRAFGLNERPQARALEDLAERWRPWRGVAARLLWSYYAAGKTTTPAVPV